MSKTEVLFLDATGKPVDQAQAVVEVMRVTDAGGRVLRESFGPALAAAPGGQQPPQPPPSEKARYTAVLAALRDTIRALRRAAK